MNQTTLHATRLADMAPATPSHGPGLQLSPCGNGHLQHMMKQVTNGRKTFKMENS